MTLLPGYFSKILIHLKCSFIRQKRIKEPRITVNDCITLFLCSWADRVGNPGRYDGGTGMHLRIRGFSGYQAIRLMDLVDIGIADAVQPDSVLGLELGDVIQDRFGELSLALVDVDHRIIGVQQAL
jgi:hypothetical protein